MRVLVPSNVSRETEPPKSPARDIVAPVVRPAPAAPLRAAALTLVKKLAAPAVREPVPEEPPILKPFFTIKSLLAILIIYVLVYR